MQRERIVVQSYTAALTSRATHSSRSSNLLACTLVHGDACATVKRMTDLRQDESHCVNEGKGCRHVIELKDGQFELRTQQAISPSSLSSLSSRPQC